MQERVPPRGWIERRIIERRCDADTPICILGAALAGYGKPTSNSFELRGIWIALALRVLAKPNRSRKVQGQQTSSTE
jgi:hypothetical protein